MLYSQCIEYYAAAKNVVDRYAADVGNSDIFLLRKINYRNTTFM